MSEHGRPFLAGLAVGGLLVVYGVVGAARDLGRSSVAWAAWIVGVDAAHDLLVAPLVCVLGALVLRRVPPVAHPPVLAGLVASGVVLLVGWLPLRGSAAAAGNPTIQPLDYRTAVGWVLGAVWVAAAGWFAVRLARRRGRRLGTSDPAGPGGPPPS